MNWLAWSLLSALFAGVTAVLAKIGVAGIDSHLATAVRTTVVVVFTWLVVALASPAGSISAIPRHAWGILTLSGIATGLSWLCYFRALQLGEVSRVAPIDKLSVAFVVVFAALFLGESLTLCTALGAGLIAAGSIILALR